MNKTNWCFVVFCAGCLSPGPPKVPGAEGRLFFRERRNYQCAYEDEVRCPPLRPRLLGSTTFVDIEQPNTLLSAPELAFQTNDPSLLSLDGMPIPYVPVSSSSRVYLVGLRAMTTGRTMLSVSSPSAALLDRIELRVEEAASIEVVRWESGRPSFVEATALRLTRGQEMALIAHCFTISGVETAASGAVTWSIPDNAVLRISLAEQGPIEVRNERVWLQSLAAGSAMLAVHTGNLRKTISVVVE